MKRKSQKKAKAPQPRGRRLYTLEVTVTSGPMTEEFDDLSPVISRTIQIREDQTLEELHWAVFDALDRYDEHLYEFQLGKRPRDPNAKCYLAPEALDGDFFDADKGDASETTIGSLGLRTRQNFWYWFDYGDDWWHKITVLPIEKDTPRGKYPKVTKRVGKSPPQYPDWDEDEDMDDEDMDDED